MLFPSTGELFQFSQIHYSVPPCSLFIAFDRFLELMPNRLLIPTRSGRDLRDEKMQLLKRSLTTRAAMKRQASASVVTLPSAASPSSPLEQVSTTSATVHLGEEVSSTSPSSHKQTQLQPSVLPGQQQMTAGDSKGFVATMHTIPPPGGRDLVIEEQPKQLYGRLLRDDRR